MEVWQPRVKEEILIQAGRRGRDRQRRRRGLMTRRQLVEQAVPHSSADKSGGTIGERDRLHNPGLQHWKIKPQSLWLKTPVGVEAAQETPSLTGEFVGEICRGLEHTQDHPPGNQHLKGPICLWVAEEVTESQQRAEQAALFPLRPLPHIQGHNAVTWVAPPWWTPKAPPLTT